MAQGMYVFNDSDFGVYGFGSVVLQGSVVCRRVCGGRGWEGLVGTRASVTSLSTNVWLPLSSYYSHQNKAGDSMCALRGKYVVSALKGSHVLQIMLQNRSTTHRLSYYSVVSHSLEDSLTR